jgi:transmembrane sensor
MEASDIDRPKLIEEAVEHIAALHTDRSGGAHARFASWVRRSKWHVEAVLIATAQLRELARLDAMVETVATRQPPANDESVRPGIPIRRAAFGGLGALAASVLVLVIVGYGSDHRTPSPGGIAFRQFANAGTVDLGFGSKMQLREHSRALVRDIDDGNGKEVTLLEGEALFTGHHQEAHPLRVLAGQFVLAVVGTEFDVVQRGAASQVTVISGAVRVSSVCPSQTATPQPAAVTLANHQMVTIDRRDCTSPIVVRTLSRDESIDNAIWTGQWRTFRGIAIGAAVKLFNDNNPNAVRMIVQDARLANRRIGGRFRVTDPEAFVNVLTQVFGARAEKAVTPDGSTVIYLRSATGP